MCPTLPSYLVPLHHQLIRPQRGLKVTLRSKQPSPVLTDVIVFNSHPAVEADVGFLEKRKRTVSQQLQSSKKIGSTFSLLHLLFAQPSQSRRHVQFPFVAALCGVCTLLPWLHGFSLVPFRAQQHRR